MYYLSLAVSKILLKSVLMLSKDLASVSVFFSIFEMPEVPGALNISSPLSSSSSSDCSAIRKMIINYTVNTTIVDKL